MNHLHEPTDDLQFRFYTTLTKLVIANKKEIEKLKKQIQTLSNNK